MTSAATVASTGGVQVAVHDLGGSGRELLVSHATGFHGRCYLPMAAALADAYHSIGFDYRGHGDTPLSRTDSISWERYSDDVEAVARTLDAPVVAFGHSMGGACLLMAAHRDPSRFEHLVLFEPIVFPPDGVRPQGQPSPLVEGARRRRSAFASYDAAIANFAAKPPLSAFTAEALDAYVRFGFAPTEDGQVQLKCQPDTEAATFELGGVHRTWDLLASIRVPVTVISGRVQPLQPSAVAGEVAGQLPHATYIERSDLDHFGPMTHPGIVAALVRSALG
jgi:pimeloyl-ACP methyl ester carboxylesterase